MRSAACWRCCPVTSASASVLWACSLRARSPAPPSVSAPHSLPHHPCISDSACTTAAESPRPRAGGPGGGGRSVLLACRLRSIFPGLRGGLGAAPRSRAQHYAPARVGNREGGRVVVSYNADARQVALVRGT
jgi:hypothetical protein